MNAQKDPSIHEINEVLNRLQALTLNNQMDERHRLLWESGDMIRQYLYSFTLEGCPQQLLRDYINDAHARFFRTLDIMIYIKDAHVLEFGGNPYLFSLLLKRLYKYDHVIANFFSKNIFETSLSHGNQIIKSNDFGEEYCFNYTHLNMELSEYPWPTGSFDMVIFSEVLEHLIVDPEQIFFKLYEIIKPGGRLIVTTPNAVRLINCAAMLRGKNIFDRYHTINGVYGRHNREFTREEVNNFLTLAGFEIAYSATLDRYNYDCVDMHTDSYELSDKLPWKGAKLLGLLSSIGAETADRGDNIYCVGNKPF